jgi:hypothetical protein
MPYDETYQTNFDLRVAYLITNYGNEAILVARENILKFRTDQNWEKEQEWLDIYKEVLLYSDLNPQNQILN